MGAESLILSVQSLGREDPMEKEVATYSSILAWRIPWTEEPGKLQSMGLQELDMQRESGSLPPCWVRSFTHRGVPIGAKNVRSEEHTV